MKLSDMLFANAMMGEGGGGGGGGDLSVAEVTITDNATIDQITVAYINTDYDDWVPSHSEAVYIPPEGTSTIQVILYKGTARASIEVEHAISVTTTGGVELNKWGEVIITGNGTITIS